MLGHQVAQAGPLSSNQQTVASSVFVLPSHFALMKPPNSPSLFLFHAQLQNFVVYGTYSHVVDVKSSACSRFSSGGTLLLGTGTFFGPVRSPNQSCFYYVTLVVFPVDLKIYFDSDYVQIFLYLNILLFFLASYSRLIGFANISPQGMQ